MNWADVRQEIRSDFGYSLDDDAASAAALNDLVPRGGWRNVGTELRNRPLAAVVGCGPQLDTLTASMLPPGVIVACDGATSRLRELEVVPRIVVTDLDGHPEDLMWAAAQGSSIVVHAHGDNMDALPLVEDLGPFVAGSCQVAPVPDKLRDYGGFTDGDRAALMCAGLGVRDIALVAFDFESPPSVHSGAFDPETKPRKLAWAQRILESAVAEGAPIRHA